MKTSANGAPLPILWLLAANCCISVRIQDSKDLFYIKNEKLGQRLLQDLQFINALLWLHCLNLISMIPDDLLLWLHCLNLISTVLDYALMLKNSSAKTTMC
jgi:hypothetical protein